MKSRHRISSFKVLTQAKRNSATIVSPKSQKSFGPPVPSWRSSSTRLATTNTRRPISKLATHFTPVITTTTIIQLRTKPNRLNLNNVLYRVPHRRHSNLSESNVFVHIQQWECNPRLGELASLSGQLSAQYKMRVHFRHLISLWAHLVHLQGVQVVVAESSNVYYISFSGIINWLIFYLTFLYLYRFGCNESQDFLSVYQSSDEFDDQIEVSSNSVLSSSLTKREKPEWQLTNRFLTLMIETIFKKQNLSFENFKNFHDVLISFLYLYIDDI